MVKQSGYSQERRSFTDRGKVPEASCRRSKREAYGELRMEMSLGQVIWDFREGKIHKQLLSIEKRF